MTNIVETIARAMRESKSWPVVFGPGSAESLARSAFTALEANGWAIVPCEPTREMIIAGETAAEDIIDWTQDSHHSYRTDEASDFPVPVYRAMISTGKAKA